MPPAWTDVRRVVDQLLLDQELAVPDRVEHLADRQRRRRVLADQPEALPGSRPAWRPPSRTGETARAPCRGVAASIGVSRWCDVVQQVDVVAELRTELSNSFGTWRRYFSVDQTFSDGSPASAGS